MFASWSLRGKAVVAGATLVAVALVAAPSVSALEGIQGRRAIFYPSIELVYQHDDNYYLTPSDEVSADTFIAHAHFALEVPGSRQYLRVEYEPQYRNVDLDHGDIEIDDDVQHWLTADAKLRGSSIFSVDVHNRFVVGNLEGHELDPNASELNRNNNEQFWKNDLKLDFNWEGSRQGAVLSVGNLTTQYDDTKAAPDWFELSQTSFGGHYFYKFTPLTSFMAGIKFTDANQEFTAAALPEDDSSRVDFWFGFDGELGRTTTGTAKLGFASLDYDDGEAIDDWDGVTLSADVTKSFSRWSKLIFGADRNVNFSNFEGNSYYISNRAAVTFSQQPQGARVGWSLKGAFQRNNYDREHSFNDGSGETGEREDDVSHFRAEVGYHPLEHMSFRLNYRYEERDSNDGSLDYTDNLIIFQVQVGF